MTLTIFWQRALLVLVTAAAVAACATGQQITRTLDVPKSADTPYQNILVIGLFSSFTVRRKFEKEVVRQLSLLGTDSVASTSMMDSKTPVTRQVFVDMVDKIDADAVMVTQIASLDSNANLKDRSPEATYNIGATYYFNVYSVELTEYVEPPSMQVDSSIVLATELFSVLTKEPVWAIESKSRVEQEVGQPGYYPFVLDESRAMTAQMLSDGVIAR